jgi:transposase
MSGGTELRAILMYDANDDAKVGFRRIKVLTGPGRRRRWSAAEKARAVAETLRPGATVSEVARRWQLCPQQLFGWRRQALREGGTQRAVEAADDRHAAFVPLIMDVPPSSSSAASAAATAAPAIEVRLADAVVRAISGVDATLLTTVLRAVRASASRR